MALPASGPLSLTDIQTEFGGSNPVGINEYYAGGGLVPAGTSGTYGAVPSSGQISIQNFYGTASVVYPYVENVFASYSYLGTGATQTITNGIDVLNSYYYSNIFFKQRTATSDSYLIGAPDVSLSTNTTATTATTVNAVTAFSTTGFTIGSNAITNTSGGYHISSTFKQTTTPKFFTQIGWTGNSAPSGSRLINHDLGSIPAFIFVKNNYNASDWWVWHQGSTSAGTNSCTAFELNTTNRPLYTSSGSMTSTQIEVGNIYNSLEVWPNITGNAYTAWLFASNAGGFGSAGTDNVITCGRFTSTTTSGSVNLGYAPQWLLIKRVQSASDWQIFDSARGFQVVSPRATAQNTYALNNTTAEVNTFTGITPSATGFDYGVLGANYMYVAIRKGNMKKPTAGTQVFSPIATNNTTGTVNTTGFAVDLQLSAKRALAGTTIVFDRLRTVATLNASPSVSAQYLSTGSTAVEAANTTITRAWTGNGFETASNNNSTSAILWNFKQAASFFDIVPYSGDGTTPRTVNHNLTVTPEFIMVRGRNVANNWICCSSYIGTVGGSSRYIMLNSANGSTAAGGRWGDTAPTATEFYVGSNSDVNAVGTNYIAYLFASCAGVSKLGTYTGTATTTTINCGFAGGARFVMIKRTDIGSTTGDWYVWDTARGMVAGTDPSISLNQPSAVEVNANSVYTVATGFQILATPTPDINTSGATYFYLAIA